MRYSSGEEINIGDRVAANGMSGEVACDFDKREFLEGYEGWDIGEAELPGGGTLSAGVMIRTEEAGLIHYAVEDGDITFLAAGGA